MKLYTSEKAFLENGVEFGKDFYLLTDHPLPKDNLTKRATYDLHRKYQKICPDYTTFIIGKLSGYGSYDRHIFSMSSNVFNEHDESSIDNFDFLYQPDSAELFPLMGKSFQQFESFSFFLDEHEYDFDSAIATYSSLKEPELLTFVEFLQSETFHEEYKYYEIRAY